MKKIIIAIIITAIVTFLGTNLIHSQHNVQVGEHETQLDSIVYTID